MTFLTYLKCNFFIVYICLYQFNIWILGQEFGELFKRGKEHRPVAKRTSSSYEECKRKRVAPRDSEALLLLEGNKLSLSCPICLRPLESSVGIWKRILPETATIIPLVFDGQRTRMLPDTSLEIEMVKRSDSGVYLCVQNMEIWAKYAIDVVQEEPHRYIIMSGKRKRRKDKASESIILKTLNLIVGISWSEWSQCNRCGTVGRRRRIGICTVRKINMWDSTKPVDSAVLSEYKKGVPCRSDALSPEIKNLSSIANLKSEFMIGFCKIPCSSSGIVVVTDKNGAVIDTVDNSEGVYSMHQPLPQLPSLVSRRSVFEEVGKRIIMSCPGSKEGKFLIWRNDSFVINPAKVHILTKGRVKIDIVNNLHIRKLQFSDAAIYSCWDDKILIGTVRLQVTEKTKDRSYILYILNIGVLFTFLTIGMITFTVCKNANLQNKQ